MLCFIRMTVQQIFFAVITYQCFLCRYKNIPFTVFLFVIRFEEPLAHMLTECRRTVRGQLEALQQRRENQVRTTQHASGPGMVLVQPSCPLVVTSPQRIQLQQQIQQVREF